VTTDAIRLPAELRCAEELAALAQNDRDPRPPGWRLSPRAVRAFVLGTDGRTLPLAIDGEERAVRVTRKFVGHDRLVERAIVTLASDRALMLIGEPGTAKSWLSEHLAAAVSGDSLLLIQGSAALTEDQVRWAWNYATLLTRGPVPDALVPAPLYTGMKDGRLVRFEELTRAPPEVQDVLLQALSEKVMVVPELPGAQGVVYAKPGFNLIATANTRDRGVNEMSAALQRRFHFETVPPLTDLAAELEVVRAQVEERTRGGPAADVLLHDDVLELLVTTFHELRSGRTTDGLDLEKPSGVLSTAEAVAVGQHAALHAAFFGDRRVEPAHVVQQLAGTAARLDDGDRKVLARYFELAVKPRAAKELGAWKAYWAARTWLT
jgi:MoxR-like ATPase